MLQTVAENQSQAETQTAEHPDRALTFAILGCGARGQTFARWIAEHPADGRVVAIAEPREDRQTLVGDLCQVPGAQRFSSWEEVLARPRMADVIVNTLMDQLHAPSAVKALELGYHMLLEKPMAVTLEDCISIDRAQRANDRMVSVCHSLRYQGTYREVKRLLDAGEIGTIVSIDQLEGVDPVHQSHSFVRGNWGNESRATFMLMAKSCHDVDVLLYLVGRDCLRVSSFGGLTHFVRAAKPPGAPARCSDGCPHETDCP
jgi:predicted dehydrogenase